MDGWEWIQENWIAPASLLFGGGSGILTKKFIDREQNKKLKDHEKTIESLSDIASKHSEELIRLDAEIKNNSAADVQFKQYLESIHCNFNQRFDDTNKKLDLILNKLLK